ncbi:venom protein 302-like [Centruroides vittatus]|uniref:venom protein 302-like n=1 Tax=Centruroides vittatus TaxID=120091 RepID=UPI00351045B8
MKSSILCSFLVICIAVAYALDCPTCDKSQCKPHGRCPAGIVKDVCACCEVCSKLIGEECGGPWNIFGICGHSSVCAKPPPPPEVDNEQVWYFNQKGICSPIV